MRASTASVRVRVLVVDDSRPFREAMRELIQRTQGFEWIGEATSGEEGIEQTAHLRPDLVLMDVRMPGIGGVEAARRIRARAEPSIVVLITGEEPSDALSDATAAAILSKQRLSPAALRQLWRARHASSALSD